jgi:choloylglycine hydrolase
MCSELYLISSEGNLISARTLDFPIPVKYQVGKVNKGSENKYSYMTVYALDNTNFIVDGINSEGLMFQLLWQGNSVFSKNQNDIEICSIAKYILGNCATVAEVREKIEGKSIFAKLYDIVDYNNGKEEKFFITGHFSVHDKNNNSIIMEVLNGTMTIYKNRYQVMTNEPLYEWHLQNVENYLHLNNSALPPAMYSVSSPIGGAALFGLPGDFTSSSRFVKMQKLVSFLSKNRYSDKQTMCLVDKIIGQVTIPEGAKMEIVPNNPNVLHFDITQYTIIKDQKNKKFYIKDISSLAYDRVYSLED